MFRSKRFLSIHSWANRVFRQLNRCNASLLTSLFPCRTSGGWTDLLVPVCLPILTFSSRSCLNSSARRVLHIWLCSSCSNSLIKSFLQWTGYTWSNRSYNEQVTLDQIVPTMNKLHLIKSFLQWTHYTWSNRSYYEQVTLDQTVPTLNRLHLIKSSLQWTGYRLHLIKSLLQWTGCVWSNPSYIEQVTLDQMFLQWTFYTWSNRSYNEQVTLVKKKENSKARVNNKIE